MPPTQSPQTKKWYQHKGIISIIILAVIAAVAVWTYAILNQPQELGPVVVTHRPKVTAINQNPTTTSSSSTTATSSPADINSWKTYTNSQYGFSVGIPEILGIQATPEESTSTVKFDFPDPKQQGQPVPVIFISIINLPGNESLNSWFVEGDSQGQELLDVGTYTQTSNPDGSSSLQQTGTTPDDYDGGPLVDLYEMSSNKKILLVVQYGSEEFSLADLDAKPADIDKMYEEFSSSFRFIQPKVSVNTVLSPTSSQISTTNWKTYTSDGLTFALPPITPPWEVSYIPGSYGSLFRIDIGAVDPVDNTDTSVIGLFGLPNTSKENLQTWFESNVDDASSTLLTSGAFQQQQLPNGAAFVDVGPIPVTYGGGPVAQAYMLSPSGTSSVYSITQSQDGSLTDFGYSISSISGILTAILGSVH